jgi:hypothetical protein
MDDKDFQSGGCKPFIILATLAGLRWAGSRVGVALARTCARALCAMKSRMTSKRNRDKGNQNGGGI